MTMDGYDVAHDLESSEPDERDSQILGIEGQFGRAASSPAGATGGNIGEGLFETRRSEAQKRADATWDEIQDHLDDMAESLAGLIQCVQSLGVSVPKKVLDIKPTLSEYRKVLLDERARRG